MLGLLAAAAGAAGVVTAGYHTMAPRSQWYGRTFIGPCDGSRTLALSFDDGPNDPHTTRLLDLLDRHGVKATFFLIGGYVRQRPEIARAIQQAGHAIGNHTYSHPNLIFRNAAEVRREIEECDCAIEDATGVRPNLFRPPYGGRTAGVLRAVRRAGKMPVMWSVAGQDWKAHSAQEIAGIVRRQVSGGDVVLLHDGGHKRLGADRSATVAATSLLLEQYRGQGWKFVTVAEMMNGAAAFPKESGK